MVSKFVCSIAKYFLTFKYHHFYCTLQMSCLKWKYNIWDKKTSEKHFFKVISTTTTEILRCSVTNNYKISMTTTVGNCRMTKLLLPDPNYIQDQFCGIVSACWARCHEIESRQGIYSVVVFKKTKAILVRQILSYIQSSTIITFKAICENTTKFQPSLGYLFNGYGHSK
jgi:hypothetical protein